MANDPIKSVENLRDRGKLVSNTLWQVGSRWGQFVAIAAVSIWVARHLGPEAFGRLAFALSAVAILKLVSMVGAELHLRSEFVNLGTSAGPTLVNAIWLRVFGSALLYGLVLISALFGYPENDDAVLLLVSGGMIFCSVTDVYQSYFSSALQARTVGLTSLCGTAIGIGIRVAAILSDAALWVFALANAVEYVIAGILMGWRFHRARPFACTWAPDWKRMKEIFWHSLPLYVSAIAISIYLRVDQLMIGWLAGDQELGWYAAAARLAERVHLIPVAIGATFLPLIIEHKQRRSKVDYENNMQRYFDLNVMISLLLIAGYFGGGQFMVGWAFGADYIPSVTILGILLLSLPFMALGVSRGQYVVAEGWYRFAMVTNVLGAVANIALNYLLIPRLGAAGAAWATLVSFCLVHVGASFLFPPTREWGRRQLLALLLPVRPARVKYIGAELVDSIAGRFKWRK